MKQIDCNGTVPQQDEKTEQQNATSFLPDNDSSRAMAFRDYITDKCNVEFANLKKAVLEDNDIDRAKLIFPFLCELGKTKLFLTELAKQQVREDKDSIRFLVSTEVLYKAYHKLCSIPTESILYAVGSGIGNGFTIERLIDLELDKSEYGYASANSTFSSKVLIEAEEYGTLLTCYFHAHPGKGINSNTPSSIDFNNQARLEKGKYRTIGGIFSRVGYVRFFSDQLRFVVSVIGKGVEHVSKDVFKLTKVS